MSGVEWGDLVTTALLGTDRRPLPPELLESDGLAEPPAPGVVRPAAAEPADVLLAAAVRHHTLARASVPLAHAAPPPVAPPPDLPDAPPPAQELLGRLLGKPLAELVNAWLAAASVHGVRAAPEHWTDLAALAATRAEVDRGLLARALGRQGSWFVDQNPGWQRLAEVVRRELGPMSAPADGSAGAGAGAGGDRASAPEVVGVPSVPSVASGTAGAAGGPSSRGTGTERAGVRLPGPAELRARPEAALEVPAPWPRALSIAALQVLLGGQLGWRAARYGAAVGARLAAADRDLLEQAGDALTQLAPGQGPALRLAREALTAVEQSAHARAEIDLTFDPPTGAGRLTTPADPAQEESDDRD